jgi:hypothetical protein
MEEQPQNRPPGLRFNGKRPVWRASKAAIAKGFPLKSVHLSHLADDPKALRQRCDRLQAEMLSWLSGRKTSTDVVFDGTFRSLLDVYQTGMKPIFAIKERFDRGSVPAAHDGIDFGKSAALEQGGNLLPMGSFPRSHDGAG